MAAYTEASKKNEKKYHPVMNGAKLDVVEKGTLIEGFEAKSQQNMTDSRYKKSIEQLIDKIQIIDEQGNPTEIITEDEHIQKYSVEHSTSRDRDLANAFPSRFKRRKGREIFFDAGKRRYCAEI